MNESAKCRTAEGQSFVSAFFFLHAFNVRDFVPFDSSFLRNPANVARDFMDREVKV